MTDTKNPKTETSFNHDLFNKIERKPTTLADVEAAVRQVMNHPAKPQSGSRNREPSQKEVSQPWKMQRGK